MALAEQLKHYCLVCLEIILTIVQINVELLNTWNNSEKHQQGTINLHHIYLGQDCAQAF